MRLLKLSSINLQGTISGGNLRFGHGWIFTALANSFP